MHKKDVLISTCGLELHISKFDAQKLAFESKGLIYLMLHKVESHDIKIETYSMNVTALKNTILVPCGSRKIFGR